MHLWIAAWLAFPVAAGAATAYVPNEGSGTISVIDTGSDAVTGEIGIGGKPRGTAVSPGGDRLYVSDRGRNVLHVYRTEAA